MFGLRSECVWYTVYMCVKMGRNGWYEWVVDLEKRFFCHTLPQPRPLLNQLTAPHTGNRYWLFREANLEPGYPQPLSSYGTDIPYDRIDTAIWWEPTGHTFFFQADR